MNPAGRDYDFGAFQLASRETSIPSVAECLVIAAMGTKRMRLGTALPPLIQTLDISLSASVSLPLAFCSSSHTLKASQFHFRPSFPTLSSSRFSRSRRSNWPRNPQCMHYQCIVARAPIEFFPCICNSNIENLATIPSS